MRSMRRVQGRGLWRAASPNGQSSRLDDLATDNLAILGSFEPFGQLFVDQAFDGGAHL